MFAQMFQMLATHWLRANKYFWKLRKTKYSLCMQKKSGLQLQKNGDTTAVDGWIVGMKRWIDGMTWLRSEVCRYITLTKTIY